MGSGVKMYLAIRDFTVRWVGYQDIFMGLKDLGLRGFELYLDRELGGGKYRDMGEEVYLGFDLSTSEKRRQFSKRLDSEVLKVCAILVENDFAKPDVELEIKWVVDACNVASEIGCDVVRINPAMGHEENVPEKEYVKRTIECCKEALDRTRHTEVSLGMENHGLMGNRFEFIKGVLEGVGSERMGLTLDTGNLYWYGYPLEMVYEIISEFATRVKHTHIKNLSFPQNRRNVMRKPGEDWPNSAATIYQGDVDHRRIVQLLRSAGYDKDLTIEDESLGKFPEDQRLRVLKEDIKFLSKLI